MGSLVVGAPPASAGTTIEDPLQWIGEVVLETGIVLSYFDASVDEWSEWRTIDSQDDLIGLEDIDPSALLLGFGDPYLEEALGVRWSDCVVLSAPSGGRFGFDFVLDVSTLAFDPETCPQPEAVSATQDHFPDIPIAGFFWIAIDEIGLEIFDCLDARASANTSGGFEGLFFIPPISYASMQTASLSMPTVDSQVSTTRARSRLFGTPLVAFLFGVESTSPGPGNGYTPIEGDAVWNLDFSMGECRRSNSVDLDHYVNRQDSSALPETH
jgi:hypothetical protein